MAPSLFRSKRCAATIWYGLSGSNLCKSGTWWGGQHVVVVSHKRAAAARCSDVHKPQVVPLVM